MAEIWTRATRQRQPQGAVAVNWGNPLTQSLLFLATPAILPPVFGGRITPTLAAGNSIAGAISGLAWADLGSGSADGVNFSAATDPLGGTTEFTTLIFSRFLALPSVTKNIVSKQKSHLFQIDSTGKIIAGVNSLSNQIDAYMTSASISTNVDALFGITFKAPGNTSTSYNGIVNGFLRPASTKAFSNFTPSSVPVNLTDTYSINSTGGINARIYYHAAFRKALSASEIDSLSANPWQLFAPERRATYFFPASTIPTLSAATAVSIGSTTATPRVTLTF